MSLSRPRACGTSFFRITGRPTARIAKPRKYGQKTVAGMENTKSVSPSAGIGASVAQKVVLHNDHLKQDFYNQYDQRPSTKARFSMLILGGRTTGRKPPCRRPFVRAAIVDCSLCLKDVRNA